MQYRLIRQLSQPQHRFHVELLSFSNPFQQLDLACADGVTQNILLSTKQTCHYTGGSQQLIYCHFHYHLMTCNVGLWVLFMVTLLMDGLKQNLIFYMRSCNMNQSLSTDIYQAAKNAKEGGGGDQTAVLEHFTRALVIWLHH